MKKASKLFLLIIATFLVTTDAFALNPRETKITIVADIWCPYNCSPESYNPGFMIEIAREIFKEKNIEVEYTTLPWSRAIEETRKGNYNAIIGATKGDAPDFIFPAFPQGMSKNGFYVRAGETWRYNGLSSLRDKIVGVIEDYDYAGEFGKYVRENRNNNLRIQFVSGDEALALNIRKLQNRRIEVIVEDEAVMSETIQRLALQDKIIFANDTDKLPSEESYLYIAFSPKNTSSAQYAKIMAEGMKELRESGKLQEILDKYNVKDWNDSIGKNKVE